MIRRMVLIFTFVTIITLIPKISQANLWELNGFIVSTSFNAINIVTNYIINKSSQYVFIDHGWINSYETVYSSRTEYGLSFSIRLPLNKQAVRDEIKDKMIWFKNNYGVTIIYGNLYRHSCKHDERGSCSTSILIWEK